MKNEVLLSICIPTYNRANLLRSSLEILLSSPEFDDSVELVISDNNSTDSTKEIATMLVSKYSDKKIKYHCNDENIKDENFYKALSLGEGKYLKLYNDYTCISNSDIAIMKQYIKKYEKNRPPLFFYHRLRCTLKVYDSIELKDTNSFVRLVNNKITWISNFGCWKEKLNCLIQFEEFKSLQLLQMYWTLHLTSQTNNIVMVNMAYQLLNTYDNNRTSYNFFQVHVDNYYSILKSYKKRHLVTDKTLRYDKYRVLSDFVGIYIWHYLIKRKDPNFKVNNSWNILFRNFWNIPYFYILPIIKCKTDIMYHLNRLKR